LNIKHNLILNTFTVVLTLF